MTAAVTENNGAGSASAVAGRVVRVIGPVVDVEFPRGAVPELFNALNAEITLPSVAKTLTLEVAQHLGDNLVRTVSMQPTDGLVRGTAVTDSGKPISVPVGDVVKGHVFNALGDCLDTPGLGRDGEQWGIHRKHQPSISSKVRPRSSRPASRSSTSSPRTSRVERSACSVAPASARPF